MADFAFAVVQAGLLAAGDESPVAPRHAPLGQARTPVRPVQTRCLCAGQFALADLLVDALVLSHQSVVDLLTTRMMRLPRGIRPRR